MAVNFPDNPSNGDTTTVNGITYTYNATSNLWKAGSSSSGGVAELGTLEQAFTTNQTADITLSSTVTPAPVVSVFKDVPQTGISSKGNWDVLANASNYSQFNEAASLYSGVDITPSSATADGTFSLDNSGTPVNISSSDVGKRVVGNGGEATITAADGSYKLATNFNDTNPITAGNWSLFGTKGAADASGITLSGASTIGNLSTVTLVTSEYTATSAWTSQPRGMTWQPDGSALYICDSSDDQVKKIVCTTPFDITTGAYAANYFTLGSVNIGDFPVDIEFKDDGTKAFILLNSTNDKVVELDLSVAWDLSTVSYVGEYSIQASDNNTFGLAVSPDGTRMMIFGAQYTTVFQFTLSTAWDVTSATASGSFVATAQLSTGFGMDWKRDGTGFILLDLTGSMSYEYSVTTAWDVTTASYTGFSHNMSLQSPQNIDTPSGITYHPQATSIWVIGYGNRYMNHWDFGGTISYPVSQYFPAVTSTGGQIDTTGWTDINTMTADETLNSGEIYYAVSTDNRTTWKVNLNGSGERSIVRNNSGTWEYNSETGATVNTFDVENLSYVGNVATSPLIANAPNPPTQSYTLADFIVSPDGTKIIIVSAQRMHELTMSTPYDITTATWTDKYDYDAHNPSTWGGFGFLEAGDSGSKIYMADWQNHKIDQFTLSTPYSFSGTVSWSGEVSNINGSGASRTMNGMYVKDSTTVFILKDDSIGNNAIIEKWTMSTPWDITTLSYNNVTFTISGQRGTDIEFSDDGTKVFIVDQFGSSTMRMFEIGTAWDITTINTSTNVVTWTTSPNPNGTSGIINFSKSGEKMYLGESTTIYEYDTSSTGTPAYNTTESWTAASTNNELAALQQALGVTINRMDSTQLNAISDANHFTLGDTLDLMIAPYTTSGSNIPISDGVTVNYDAASLVEQAINGTDYKVQFPANDTVKIISLADQTLKIRIL